MTAIRRVRRWAGIIALCLAVGIGLYFSYRAIAGWPSTPMTVSKADNLFAHGVQPGQTVDEVKAWLASRSIPPQSSSTANGGYYSNLCRREDATFESWWMDRLGNQSVAECAGLNGDNVHSIMRVEYPEADRSIFIVTRITVYLFFDENERLIRYWIGKFFVGL